MSVPIFKFVFCMMLMLFAVSASSAQRRSSGTPTPAATPAPKPTPRTVDTSVWVPLFADATDKLKKQDYEGAIVPLTKCLSLTDVFPCYYGRITSYALTGKADLAMADVDKALGFWPEESRLYGARAQLYQMKKQWNMAYVDLTDAIRFDSKNPTYYLQRAIVQCNQIGGGVFDPKEGAKKDEAKAVELGGKVTAPCR